MSKSKDTYEVNSHLEHLFWKRDLEPMDLMKLHGEEQEDVTSEINNYLYSLPAELTLDFFNKDEEKFSAYKEAQDYFNSADFEKDLMKDYNDSKRDGTLTSDGYYNVYYQPTIHTKLIEAVLKENNLKDTRQNRYCIAMVERKEAQMCDDYQWNDEILASRVRQIVLDLISTQVVELNSSPSRLDLLEAEIINLKDYAEVSYESLNAKLKDVRDGSASLNSIQRMRAEAEAMEHGKS